VSSKVWVPVKEYLLEIVPTSEVFKKPRKVSLPLRQRKRSASLLPAICQTQTARQRAKKTRKRREFWSLEEETAVLTSSGKVGWAYKAIRQYFGLILDSTDVYVS